eukprot:TRINITY_DN7226_c0_g1_i1.p1 TRINITY_DN7226_c0_g1~~TRINITY_DN7226_c0_g1_i1.p1  ORF type:complete len:351 (-),score=19.11 TRINITY_DN7226_c0_g1_i1:593-1645(-)
MQTVIAPAHSNCKISESYHHEERGSALDGNKQVAEVDVLRASWRNHLMQALANGFHFTTKSSLNQFRPAGDLVTLMMHELFHHKKSKIQIPEKEPYIPHDWLGRKLVPAICKDNIIARKFVKRGTGSHYRGEFTDALALRTTKDITGDDSLPGIKLYLKASKIIVPKLGVVAIGDVVQVVPKTFNSVNTSTTLMGDPCDLILVDSIFCIPNQKDPYIQKSSSVPLISTELYAQVTEIKRKQDSIQLEIDVINKEISCLQSKACDLDRSKRKLEYTKRGLEQRDKNDWVPNVYLRGVALKEDVSKHKFKAATVAVPQNHSILFKGTQIHSVYTVHKNQDEQPGLLTINKYY